MKGVLIGAVAKAGSSMLPRAGGPGGNGIQLKEGQLEMSIGEDFLAVRTAGFENGLPREGREAPSLRTLETAQSHTVP